MAQTVPTTASTMTTAKPLLPEIALTMVTSLKATYSPPCPVSLITGRGCIRTPGSIPRTCALGSSGPN